MYLLVSAWQIRNGYPRLCNDNIITRGYDIVNLVCFQIYTLAPFLFEIRTVIDWTWTDTTMPLFDFIKMEILYWQVYLVKCYRVMDEASFERKLAAI